MNINTDLTVAGMTGRQGLIVYLTNVSEQFKLRYYGDIVYFSKKFRYCIMYIDGDDQATIDEIRALPFVERIELSGTDQLDLTSEHIEQQVSDLALSAEQELEKRQNGSEDKLQ